MKAIGARTPKGGVAGDGYGPMAGIVITPDDAAEGIGGIKRLVDFMLSNAKVCISLAYHSYYVVLKLPHQMAILLEEHARVLNTNMYKSLRDPWDLGVQGLGSTSGTLYTCNNYASLSHTDPDGSGGSCSQWSKPRQLKKGDWSFGYFKWRVELETRENMIWYFFPWRCVTDLTLW